MKKTKVYESTRHDAVSNVEDFFEKMQKKLDDIYDGYDISNDSIPRGFKLNLIADNGASPAATILSAHYNSLEDELTLDLMEYDRIKISKIKEHVAPYYSPDIFSAEGVRVSGDGLFEIFGVTKNDYVYCDMSIYQ